MGFGNKVKRSERFNEIAYAWLKEKLTVCKCVTHCQRLLHRQWDSRRRVCVCAITDDYWLLSYISKVNSGNLNSFRHHRGTCRLYNHFAVEKVGGSCSHLSPIGPRVSAVLASLALWLQRPCRRPEMGPRPGPATATPGGWAGEH